MPYQSLGSDQSEAEWIVKLLRNVPVHSKTEALLVQNAIIGNFAAVKREASCDEIGKVSLDGFLVRVYIRSLNQNPSVEDVDGIVATVISSVAHDLKRTYFRKHWFKAEQIDENYGDANALGFLFEIMRQNELCTFRRILDPWTLMAFDLWITRSGKPAGRTLEEIAHRLAEKPNNFRRKFKRRIEYATQTFEELRNSSKNWA